MYKFMIESEQRRWADDINYFYKWKNLRDIATADFAREMCQRQMERLANAWPNQKKEFEF